MKVAPTVCVATAYHEAGHVVMGCITRRIPVSATIVADGRVQGMVRFDDIVPESAKRQFDRSPEHERHISDRVMGELAGSIGHDLGCPGRERDEGDDDDDANARTPHLIDYASGTGLIFKMRGGVDDGASGRFLHALRQTAQNLHSVLE